MNTKTVTDKIERKKLKRVRAGGAQGPNELPEWHADRQRKRSVTRLKASASG